MTYLFLDSARTQTFEPQGENRAVQPVETGMLAAARSIFERWAKMDQEQLLNKYVSEKMNEEAEKFFIQASIV